MSKKKKTACVGAQNGQRGVVLPDTPIVSQIKRKIKIGEQNYGKKT